jgi:hypothetical protein
MMAADDQLVANIRRDVMKKLIPLVVGLTLAFGTVATSFAQTPEKTEKKAKKKKKKSGDDSTPKKDGGK